MTEKLYENDSYLREFTATVLSCEMRGERYAVRLDRTAFFPEGGGQFCDQGHLDGQPVLDVRTEGGLIWHFLASPIESGKTVKGEIDFDLRYRRMQNHTGEHIVSGIVHRLYGYDNVGFHLGDGDVTLDFSGELTRSQLDEVERLANAAVWRNLPVTVSYPTSEELDAIEYRSKLDLTENVRIVSIGDIDVCACCAPHVAESGEIGIIKLLDFMRYKGGIRLHILCGEAALDDYRARYADTRDISQLLSVKQHETVEAVSQLLAKNEELKLALREARRERLALLAETLAYTDGNRVIRLSASEKDYVREAVNLTVSLAGGVTVAIAGDDAGGYRYAIGSGRVDLRAASKTINATLSGRGGGSPAMIEGNFSVRESDIRAYFEATVL